MNEYVRKQVAGSAYAVTLMVIGMGHNIMFVHSVYTIFVVMVNAVMMMRVAIQNGAFHVKKNTA